LQKLSSVVFRIEALERVAIFGVGLIGGSFALALREAGFQGRILGVDTPETARRACDLGVIDEALAPQPAAQLADLVYLALPISGILEILPQLDRWVQADALITDAGSTKDAIVRRARESVARCQFLGGHPLAGRELRGVEAADPVLFRGRRYVLTPRTRAELDHPRAREFVGWIEKIGALPVILDAAEHDRIVAFTSHLPQLASSALASLLEGRTEAQSHVFGPALVDSTRLALSSFDIWGDILETNRGEIGAALETYIRTLQAFARVLELDPEGLREHFRKAAKFAGGLRDTT